MELEITEREEKELLDREDIELELSHPGEPTPSAAEVRDQISAELDLDPKTVEIESIYSSTGLSTSEGLVKVHDEPVYEELPEKGEEGEEEQEEEESGEDEESEEEAEEEEPEEETDEEGDAEEEPEDESEESGDDEEVEEPEESEEGES
ncbi:MAG: hypothetical protein SVS85_01695 [Candidatus Nanohaloarchaea archaeon]|nr:hypothetical protein [Candidatus Nanohaloarchaea archaeon]